MLERRAAGAELRESRFDDNYAFFRSQIPRGGGAAASGAACSGWSTSSITLGTDANAQQIFESLNSTGEPLRNHELIHNYVLMGLSHAAAERDRGRVLGADRARTPASSIGSFWRHYLVMTTGREVDTGAGRGRVRHVPARVPAARLRAAARARRRVAGVLRRCTASCSIRRRRPTRSSPASSSYVNTFGRGMYPLVMRAYHDYTQGGADKATLIGTLERIQSLLLRRTVGRPEQRPAGGAAVPRAAQGAGQAGERDRPDHPVG